MAPPLLRFTLAALACLLCGAPGVDGSRIAVSELADASADEAQGFQPMKVWTAAAASARWFGDRRGSAPPQAGVAAPPFHPAGVGYVRSPSQPHMFQHMFRGRGGINKEGGEKEDWPEDNGVAEINRHSDEYFGGVLRCSWTPTKGRILRATRDFALGEIIYKENPLSVVQRPEQNAAFRQLEQLGIEYDNAFEHETLWYWCAIQSLTKEQLKGAPFFGISGVTPEIQKKLLQLYHERVKQPSEAAKIIAKKLVPNADAITIEQLFWVWALNAFEFSDEPLGLATYYLSSFMSHSCFPNAVWHFSEAAHVLRARREIKEGDEVCISYLPPSTLYQSAPVRRMRLHDSKGFWCDCERCRPGRKDFSRGVKCPECGKGTIFAKTPMAGPAADASLLPSQWAGACCDRCGHVVSNAQSQKLAKKERIAKQLLNLYPPAPDRDLEYLKTDEAFLDKYFTQHVLADLTREQIGFFYALTKRVPDELRQLERRVAFHKAAYPGLASAKAWTLVALGDCFASGGTGVDPDPEAARRCYTEALVILQLLFGDKDGYDDEVVKKLARLNRGGPGGGLSS